MQQIILASQSPRRKDLMDMMDLSFDIVPSDFEEWLDDSLTPQEVSMELGYGKANAVAVDHPDSIVIGSDTIVTIDGHQLGKPATMDEAREMFMMLAGKTHEVTSSLAIVLKSAGFIFRGGDTAHVIFRPFDEERYGAYLAQRDSLDKAGGYGIQSGASILIESIEGHYDTILGLPTWLLAEELNKLGVAAKPATVEPPEFI